MRLYMALTIKLELWREELEYKGFKLEYKGFKLSTTKTKYPKCNFSKRR